MKRMQVLAAVALLAGCGSGGSATASAAASPGPVLAVERFLQAANANDLKTMAQLFGTADKTIVELEGESTAEQRMHVLASLLRHDDFMVRGQETVPGRIHDATTLMVELEQGGRRVVVPHLVVRKNGGGWIIEKIDVERLTHAQ